MVLIFKTLVDLWRERLAHLDALLAKHPYDSWRLRAEHKVLEYLVRRYENDAPSWPLGPRSARRNLRLWSPEINQPLPADPRSYGAQTRQELEDTIQVYCNRLDVLRQMNANAEPPQSPEAPAAWYWRYDSLILCLIYLLCLAAMVWLSIRSHF